MPDEILSPSRSRHRLTGPFQRLRRLRRARGRTVDIVLAPELPEDDAAELRGRIADLLVRQETSSQRVAVARVADAYLSLNAKGRERFFRVIAEEFGTDPRKVDDAIHLVESAPSGTERVAAELALRQACVPAYSPLLHLFTRLDQGVKFLVDFREDLRTLDLSDPHLRFLEAELVGHLSTLFDVALLDLQRITWSSPATLLEKLIEYEAVHEIESWTDLKNRLGSDRRCYAFFHPAMPEEPLIFVEIALTEGLAGHLPSLLDESAPIVAPERADTAIFYSITSCQPGLAGINLGNELIKQVVDELQRSVPSVRTFATLSPIPGFRAWLESRLAANDLRDGERSLLPGSPSDVLRLVRDGAWANDEDTAASLRPGLLALCARYLTTERRGPRTADPVANFHLSNGASVEQLNWMANPTDVGMERAVGIMVNYLYDPARIASNADAYANEGAVAASDSVRDLVAR